MLAQFVCEINSVSALDDKDEFDTLCLGSHRSTSSWAKAYAESGLREGLG
jgi:hypothetical protein